MSKKQFHELVKPIRGGKVTVKRDPIEETLDEMADLCEYWKRQRDKGRHPTGIRAALLSMAGELMMVELERIDNTAQKNAGPEDEPAKG